MGSSFSAFTCFQQFGNRFFISSSSNSFNNSKPVDAPTTASDGTDGDDAQKDHSKRISELVQPRFLAICAGSLSLLVNPPKIIPEQLIVLYKLYLLFLLFSFLPCIALCLIPKGTPSEGTAQLHEQAMKFAMVSITISVTLRIILELPPPIEWYEVLIPFLIAIVTLVYLRYHWINYNSGQTVSSEQKSSDEIDTPDQVSSLFV